MRRRDRPLDERHVVRPLEHARRGLCEIGDLHGAGERQELVLAIEQRELATVAGGEFEDRELGPLLLLFAFLAHLTPPGSTAAAPSRHTDTQGRLCRRTTG